jgi:hypothetical protein
MIRSDVDAIQRPVAVLLLARLLSRVVGPIWTPAFLFLPNTAARIAAQGQQLTGF